MLDLALRTRTWGSSSIQITLVATICCSLTVEGSVQSVKKSRLGHWVGPKIGWSTRFRTQIFQLRVVKIGPTRFLGARHWVSGSADTEDPTIVPCWGQTWLLVSVPKKTYWNVPNTKCDAFTSWRMLYKSCDRLGIPASQAIDVGNLFWSWEQHEMKCKKDLKGSAESELIRKKLKRAYSRSEELMVLHVCEFEWPLRIHESKPAAWAKLGWLAAGLLARAIFSWQLFTSLSQDSKPKERGFWIVTSDFGNDLLVSSGWI